MRTPARARMAARLSWLPVVFLIAGCAGANMPGFSATAPVGPVPPAIQPEQIVGRWGLAAYQREEDRTRTEAEARSQCRQAYEIVPGPSGGVIMHLADQAQPEELQLKGLAGGRTFVGPAGEAGGQQDREIVSFDGRVMVMRWIDADVAARYGTAVYVRCDGPGSRVAQKKQKRRPAARTKQQPVFMAPPPDEPPAD
jgi:hypothetical protein